MQPLNRHLSRRVTPALIALRLTPNQVTMLGFGAGCLAAWNFLHGSPAERIIGALWFQLSYLLDNCDGEIARQTGTSSGFGSWLDTLTDCVIHMAFFTSLGLGLSRQTGQPVWVLLGGCASSGVLLSYVGFLLEQYQLRGPEALVHPDPPYRAPVGWFRQLRKICREDFSFVVLVSAIVGKIAWLLWCGLFGAFFIGIFEITVVAARMLRKSARIRKEAA